MHTQTVLQEDESGEKVEKSICDAILGAFAINVTRDSWPLHLIFSESLPFAITPLDRRNRRNTHKY